MKWGLLASVLFSVNALAGSFDGVLLNCLEKAEVRMSKYERMGLASVCRDRKSPSKEHYTFCDGSGCTGFSADSANSCKFSDWWDGQDDQDSIDPVEWKESCLTEEDFKKPVSKPEVNAKVTAKKVAESSIVSDSREYVFEGNTKGLKTLELAELVGKQIRREYYQQNYKVEAYDYKEVRFQVVESDLSRKDGEFPGLSKKEMNKIERWLEDHSVAAIVKMNLTSEYMSGTGMESNYIFLPVESYEPILVVRKFFYAE